MPELPEVETIRRGLERYLVGDIITDIEIRLPRIIRGDYTHILNAKVVAIRRFGKGLIIDGDNGYSIAVHVKMTGQLIYRGSKVTSQLKNETKLPNKWTHVIFKLKSEEEAYLYYNDIRQFGWIEIVQTEKAHTLGFFKSLGPEPLRNLDLITFTKIVKSSKASIKSLLMNQQKIAGIGNIYANDALFLAKVHPARKSATLDEQEIKKLFEAIEYVLSQSITVGGASEINFVNALGEKGNYQNHFLVYDKEGKPCKNCGTSIKRIKIAGRSSFFCPQCQI